MAHNITIDGSLGDLPFLLDIQWHNFGKHRKEYTSSHKYSYTCKSKGANYLP